MQQDGNNNNGLNVQHAAGMASGGVSGGLGADGRAIDGVNNGGGGGGGPIRAPMVPSYANAHNNASGANGGGGGGGGGADHHNPMSPVQRSIFRSGHDASRLQQQQQQQQGMNPYLTHTQQVRGSTSHGGSTSHSRQVMASQQPMIMAGQHLGGAPSAAFGMHPNNGVGLGRLPMIGAGPPGTASRGPPPLLANPMRSQTSHGNAIGRPGVAAPYGRHAARGGGHQMGAFGGGAFGGTPAAAFTALRGVSPM